MQDHTGAPAWDSTWTHFFVKSDERAMQDARNDGASNSLSLSVECYKQKWIGAKAQPGVGDAGGQPEV